jgi:hypothetical protein
MSEFAESKDGLVTLAPSPHHLAVVSTTSVGLVAAAEVFGSRGAVILEEAERLYWFTEVYKDHLEPLRWYTFAWWTLEEGAVGTRPDSSQWRASLLPGSSYWIVNSGVDWGPLAGGGEIELWQWDGERATCLEGYGFQS